MAAIMVPVVSRWLLQVGQIFPRLAVFTATGSWTAPAGITSIFVECWGAGGPGGPGGLNGGGGGGGGAYAAGVVGVTPGNAYTAQFTPGPGFANAFAGDVNSVSAANGFGPADPNLMDGGRGGSACTGTTIFPGGAGGSGWNAVSAGGGGGGGSGGPFGAGNNGQDAIGTTGGAGAIIGANQGAGGAGGDNLAAGGNGAAPGGGAGGAGNGAAAGLPDPGRIVVSRNATVLVVQFKKKGITILYPQTLTLGPGDNPWFLQLRASPEPGRFIHQHLYHVPYQIIPYPAGL